MSFHDTPLLPKRAALIALLALALVPVSCSGGTNSTIAPPTEPHRASTDSMLSPGRKPRDMPARVAHPATIDTWTGGTGNWSTPGNWSNGTPAPSADVIIDNDPSRVSNVTLDVPASINSLTLDADDSLTQAPSQAMTVTGSSIDNAGTYTMNSAGLYFGSSPVVLSGRGIVTMTGASSIRNGTSFNNADNLIQGVGNIGSGSIALQNSGRIHASGGTLTVQGNGSGLTNSGSLEGGSGGTLVIYSATTQTGAGTIAALSGGKVQLHDPVSGGRITSAAGGAVQVLGGNAATLDGVTMSGLYDILSSGTTTLVHTIANDGTIALDSTGAGTPLVIQGTVTLTGSGKVKMSDNQNNVITPGSSNPLLLNHNTIEGAGGISAPIDNFATIDANRTTPLAVLASSTSTNTNAHIMEATSGGTLLLDGGTVDNHNGTIIAKTGSQVLIYQNTISGGTLTTQGSGTFQGQAGRLDGKTSPLTNNGTVVVTNYNFLSLQGTIKNNARINATHGGSLSMNDSLTLDGSGIVSLDTGGIAGQSPQTLINHNTIEGSGQVTGMAIQNLGTIAANAAAQLTIAPDSTGLTTSGSVKVASASTLAVNGAFSETAGTIAVDGTLTTNSGLTIQGGALSGRGSMSGNVTSSGVLRPGDSTQQPAIFSMAGNYAQSASGEFDATIGGLTAGTQYNRLAITGPAALAGTFRITRINGFMPAIGDTFEILTATSVGGRFATIIGAAIDSGEHFSVIYQSNGVQLKVVSGP